NTAYELLPCLEFRRVLFRSLARGRILRALDRRAEAHADFAAAMYFDPSNREARDGLASLRPEAHHELRIGSDTDWFNFADANHRSEERRVGHESAYARD